MRGWAVALLKSVLQGRGKESAAPRTIVAADFRGRWIFPYGFGKNERDNIDDDELRAFRRIATALIAMTPAALERAVGTGELKEIDNG